MGSFLFEPPSLRRLQCISTVQNLLRPKTTEIYYIVLYYFNTFGIFYFMVIEFLKPTYKETRAHRIVVVNDDLRVPFS